MPEFVRLRRWAFGVALTDGTMAFEDLAAPAGPFRSTLKPVAVRVANLSNAENAEANVELTLATDGNEQLTALVAVLWPTADERAREGGLFDEEVSLGDFVLPGGEVAALALLEAVSRFVPGVVGEAESVRLDSFEDGLLDYPHYTRPRELRGLAVPEILLSGHHERIRMWRRERQFEETARYRPDLLERFVPSSPEDRELLSRVARRPRTP